MVKGQLDISTFPLDYASGKHPQFSPTLMPGLVKNHDPLLRPHRLAKSWVVVGGLEGQLA